MAGFGIRHFCIFIFVQIVAGRIIDLEYGYQELEESIPQNDLETKKNSDTIEELCSRFKGRIYIREIDEYIDCSESLFEDSREVKLVKRDTEKNEELEGSGDSDDQIVPSTEAEPETTTILIIPSEPQSILKETDEQNTTHYSTETKDTTSSVALKESDASTTEPTLYKNGFDEILKNKLNVSLTEGPNPPAIVGSGLKEETSTLPASNVSSTEEPTMYKNGFDEILKNQLNVNQTKGLSSNPPAIMRSGLKDESSKSSPNDGKSPIVTAEEAVKTGESKEKSSEMSPNNVLLIILGVLGVVGILALVFNYVKKAKDNKEVEEVLRMEAEGRELKEMKPLMKDPLTQNGSKSLEYIDADPQYGNGVEVKAEVNHNHDVEHN